MRDEYAELNKEVFAKHPEIKWFDKHGVLKIGKKVKATIELVDIHVQGHYESYLVKAVNDDSGLLTSHLFEFVEHLPEQRMRQGGQLERRYIWQYGREAPHWYGEKPTRAMMDALAAKVMEFVAMWRTE